MGVLGAPIARRVLLKCPTLCFEKRGAPHFTTRRLKVLYVLISFNMAQRHALS